MENQQKEKSQQNSNKSLQINLKEVKIQQQDSQTNITNIDQSKQKMEKIIKNESQNSIKDEICQDDQNQQQQEQQEINEESDNDHQKKIRLDVREATHSGYWYTNKKNELQIQINVWIDMAKCEISNLQKVKALIAPIKVFLLGSAHHCFLRLCCLSGLTSYSTPLGDIKLDQEIIKKLNESNIKFEELDKDADEEEHSFEMQLPFLAQILGTQNFTLIPILVGSLEQKQEEEYAKILQPYFERDDTLFVISTDFCHWGKKYKYTYLEKDEQCEIYESIEKLDQRAMELIELHDIGGFHEYLKETGNTICGKHAIAILLRLFLSSKTHEIETKFIKYSMEHLIKDQSESSISFASAVSYIEKQNQSSVQ